MTVNEGLVFQSTSIWGGRCSVHRVGGWSPAWISHYRRESQSHLCEAAECARSSIWCNLLKPFGELCACGPTHLSAPLNDLLAATGMTTSKQSAMVAPQEGSFYSIGYIYILVTFFVFWGSLSNPRTLRHARQGNRTSDLLVTRIWLYPQPHQPLLYQKRRVYFIAFLRAILKNTFSSFLDWLQ